MLDPHRLFPPDPTTRSIAAALYASVRDLPIVSPHGHTEAWWFAKNHPFPDPAALLIKPDHYIFRMLYSQGISLESLGLSPVNGSAEAADPREVWRLFANHYKLFRGTPTRLWLDFVFCELFGFTERLRPENADFYFDRMQQQLQTPEFLPRALFERFRIETLATTDTANDALGWHEQIRRSGWQGRVLPTFRPDALIDSGAHGFRDSVDELGTLTGEDVASWQGYLNALRQRRAFFKAHGATATDHGPATALTADLEPREAENLYQRVYTNRVETGDHELFQAQMLTEMAGMSVDDGLVMQLHPGAFRNHNATIHARFGRDKGADVPRAMDYVRSLRPLLNRYGNEPGFTLILFTLDESTYARELAPLAGHYPCLRLGPAWWFHDSPEGMMRYREQTTETAGFYNTVGFNDDTRAFLSIPARHDTSRRVDCSFLAKLVAEHRLEEDEAFELAQELTVGLVRRAYKLGSSPAGSAS